MPLSHDFVVQKFREYYLGDSHIEAPTLIGSREFGFLLFKNGIMIRHQSFKNLDELKQFLRATPSMGVYFSSAYYGNPKGTMQEKEWKGADLVFDIDSDHIPTPCKDNHDHWTCSCKKTGKGIPPKQCSVCGETRFERQQWTCEECLKAAAAEALKLLDILQDDFGFTQDELMTYFSGNRGYHIHVESEETRLLDSPARKEIVDYVIGLGIRPELHRAELDTGWGRRISNGIEQVIKTATLDDFMSIGVSKKEAHNLIDERDDLVDTLRKSGVFNWLGSKIKTRNKLVTWVIKQQAANVDTVVTTDIHRLIRLSGSLHGKTGLMKTKIPSGDLGNYDPLKEAVAFKEGEVILNCERTPQFRLGTEYHGPFDGEQQVALPTAAAVFLLCKGVAKVVG